MMRFWCWLNCRVKTFAASGYLTQIESVESVMPFCSIASYLWWRTVWFGSSSFVSGCFECVNWVSVHWTKSLVASCAFAGGYSGSRTGVVWLSVGWVDVVVSSYTIVLICALVVSCQVVFNLAQGLIRLIIFSLLDYVLYVFTYASHNIGLDKTLSSPLKPSYRIDIETFMF